MTIWYFDSVNGSDSNNGTSPATPKQNYHLFPIVSTASGDTFLFKRGTIQLIATAWTQVRSGSSDSVRTRYAVYGESDFNYCTWTNPTGVGTMVLNMASQSYVDMEDMRFDAGGRVTNGIYAAVQGASNVVGHRFFRCHFKNAISSGLNVGIEGGKTGTPSGFIFEDCEFYDNGGHGLILSGANSSFIRRCRFYRNGATLSTGGHGFSAGAGKTSASSGWTNTSGTIWQRTLAVNETAVYYVQTSVFPYLRIRQTAGTQTAPGIGEYGVSGGILYINVNSGSNPGGQGIIYAWKRCHSITVEDCEAYENYWNRAAPYHEGHGFAFDDFTDDSFFQGNRSYNNQGAGFSINRGDRNKLVGNIAYGNWQAGLVTNPSDDDIIVNNTFFRNNTGIEAHAAEVVFNGYCKGAIVSNNIILPTVSYGVSRDTSDTGFTGTKNCIYGYTSDAEKNAFLTGTINVHPEFDTKYRPQAARLKRAGTYLGYRDFYGKQFYDPPNIGAVDDVTAAPRYALRAKVA